MPEEMQQTFDWMAETAEVVEGIKLDENEDYEFTLAEITPKYAKRKDGSYVDDRDGNHRKVIDLTWELAEMRLKFKMSIWVNNNERVNPGNPEIESDNVKLGRRLGYNPVLGGQFALKDFIHLGMQIKAKVAPQVSKDPKTGAERTFYNIMPASIVGLGTIVEIQNKLPDAPDAAMVEEIKVVGKGSKNLKELTGKINKIAAKDPSKFQLLQVAMQMNESGALKFPL